MANVKNKKKRGISKVSDSFLGTEVTWQTTMDELLRKSLAGTTSGVINQVTTGSNNQRQREALLEAAKAQKDCLGQLNQIIGLMRQKNYTPTVSRSGITGEYRIEFTPAEDPGFKGEKPFINIGVNQDGIVLVNGIPAYSPTKPTWDPETKKYELFNELQIGLQAVLHELRGSTYLNNQQEIKGTKDRVFDMKKMISKKMRWGSETLTLVDHSSKHDDHAMEKFVNTKIKSSPVYNEKRSEMDIKFAIEDMLIKEIGRTKASSLSRPIKVAYSRYNDRVKQGIKELELSGVIGEELNKKVKELKEQEFANMKKNNEGLFLGETSQYIEEALRQLVDFELTVNPIADTKYLDKAAVVLVERALSGLFSSESNRKKRAVNDTKARKKNHSTNRRLSEYNPLISKTELDQGVNTDVAERELYGVGYISPESWEKGFNDFIKKSKIREEYTEERRKEKLEITEEEITEELLKKYDYLRRKDVHTESIAGRTSVFSNFTSVEDITKKFSKEYLQEKYGKKYTKGKKAGKYKPMRDDQIRRAIRQEMHAYKGDRVSIKFDERNNQYIAAAQKTNFLQEGDKVAIGNGTLRAGGISGIDVDEFLDAVLRAEGYTDEQIKDISFVIENEGEIAMKFVEQTVGIHMARTLSMYKGSGLKAVCDELNKKFGHGQQIFALDNPDNPAHLVALPGADKAIRENVVGFLNGLSDLQSKKDPNVARFAASATGKGLRIVSGKFVGGGELNKLNVSEYADIEPIKFSEREKSAVEVSFGEARSQGVETQHAEEYINKLYSGHKKSSHRDYSLGLTNVEISKKETAAGASKRTNEELGQYGVVFNASDFDSAQLDLEMSNGAINPEDFKNSALGKIDEARKAKYAELLAKFGGDKEALRSALGIGDENGKDIPVYIRGSEAIHHVKDEHGNDITSSSNTIRLAPMDLSRTNKEGQIELDLDARDALGLIRESKELSRPGVALTKKQKEIFGSKIDKYFHDVEANYKSHGTEYENSHTAWVKGGSFHTLATNPKYFEKDNNLKNTIMTSYNDAKRMILKQQEDKSKGIKAETDEDYETRLQTIYKDIYRENFGKFSKKSKEKKAQIEEIQNKILEAMTYSTDKDSAYQKTGGRGMIAMLHRYPSSNGKDIHFVRVLIDPNATDGELSGDTPLVEAMNADYDGDTLYLTYFLSDGSIIQTWTEEDRDALMKEAREIHKSDSKRIDRLRIRGIKAHEDKGTVSYDRLTDAAGKEYTETEKEYNDRILKAYKDKIDKDFDIKGKEYSPEEIEKMKSKLEDQAQKDFDKNFGDYIKGSSETARGEVKGFTGLFYNAYESVRVLLHKAGLDEAAAGTDPETQANARAASIVRAMLEAPSQNSISAKKIDKSEDLGEQIHLLNEMISNPDNLLGEDGKVDRSKVLSIIRQMQKLDILNGDEEGVFTNRIHTALFGVEANEKLTAEQLADSFMRMNSGVGNEGKGSLGIFNLAEALSVPGRHKIIEGSGSTKGISGTIINSADVLTSQQLAIYAQSQAQLSETVSGTNQQLTTTNILLNSINSKMDNLSVKGLGGAGGSGGGHIPTTAELAKGIDEALKRAGEYPLATTTLVKRAMPFGGNNYDLEGFEKAIEKGSIEDYFGYGEENKDLFRLLREKETGIQRGNVGHSFAQALTQATKLGLITEEEIFEKDKNGENIGYMKVLNKLLGEDQSLRGEGAISSLVSNSDPKAAEKIAFLKSLWDEDPRAKALGTIYSKYKDYNKKVYTGVEQTIADKNVDKVAALGELHYGTARAVFGDNFEGFGTQEQGILYNANGNLVQGYMDLLAYGKMAGKDGEMKDTILGLDLKNPNSEISVDGMAQALEYYEGMRQLQQYIKDKKYNYQSFSRSAYGKKFKQVTGQDFDKDLFERLKRGDEIQYAVKGINAYGKQEYRYVDTKNSDYHRVIEILNKAKNNPELYNQRDLKVLLESVFKTSTDPNLIGKTNHSAFAKDESKEITTLKALKESYEELLETQNKIQDNKLIQKKLDAENTAESKVLSEAYEKQNQELEKNYQTTENLINIAGEKGLKLTPEELKKYESDKLFSRLEFEHSMSKSVASSTKSKSVASSTKSSSGGQYRGSGLIDQSIIRWVDRLMTGQGIWRFISMVRRGLTQFIQKAKELDKAMTDLRIVTNDTAANTKTAISEYAKLAKILGSTTSEVTKSAVEWLRQGYETAQVNDLITASMYLSKLGMISSTDATKDLTSAMKGFKMEASEAMDVVDKLTAIDLKAATSAGEIAKGLSEFANLAQLSGVDIDQASAYVATIADVTQSPGSSVGTALKTIISRYGNVKAGVYNKMDTEQDDNGETSESLNDVEKVLHKLNIDIRDSKLEFKDFDVVLDEIADKWTTLDSVSKKAIAVAFAGVRQQESFVTLMNNYDKYESLLKTSKESEGTAETKYASYKESYEAAKNSLTAAIEELANNSSLNRVLTDLTNTGKNLLEFLGNILKYLPGIISSIESAKALAGKSAIQTVGYRMKDLWSGKTDAYGRQRIGFRDSVQYKDSLWNKWRESGKEAREQKKKIKEEEKWENTKITKQKQLTKMSKEELVNKKLVLSEAEKEKLSKSKITKYATLELGKKEGILDSAKIEEAVKKGVITESQKEWIGKKKVVTAAHLEAMVSAGLITDAEKEKLLKDQVAADAQKEAREKGKTGSDKFVEGITAAGIVTGSLMASLSAYSTGAATHKTKKRQYNSEKGKWEEKEVEVESSEEARNAGRGLAVAGGIFSAIPIIGILINSGLIHWSEAIAASVDYQRDQANAATENANTIIAGLDSFKSSITELGKLEFGSIESESAVKSLLNNLYSEDNIQTRQILDSYLSDKGGIYKVLNDIQDNTKTTAEKMESYRALQIAQLQAQKDQVGNKYASSLYNSGSKVNSAYADYNNYSGYESGAAAWKGVKTDLASGAAGAVVGGVVGAILGASGPAGWIIGAIGGLLIGLKAAIDAASSKAEEERQREAREAEFNQMSIGEKIASVNETLDEAIKAGDTELVGKCNDLLAALQEQNSVVNQMLDEMNDITLQQGLIAASVKEYNEDGSIKSQKYISDMTIAELKGSGIDNILKSYAEAIEENGGLIGENVWADAAHTKLSDAGYDYLFNKLRSQGDEEINAVLNGQSYTLNEAIKLANDPRFKGQRWVRDLLSSFSSALNVPIDQLEEIQNKFGELTLSEMLMSTSELSEKIEGYTGLLSSITSGAGDVSKWMSTIISQFPDLIAYMGDISTLFSKIGTKLNQLSESYLQSQYEDIASNESYFKTIEETLYSKLGSAEVEILKGVGGTGVTSISGIMTWLKTQYKEDGSLSDEGQKVLAALKTTTEEFGTEVTSSILKQYYDQLIEFKTQALDVEIENLNEQKQALQDINSQREYENKLIEAKLKLENASKEKKRVYRAGVGWVYEEDQQALKAAQEELSQLENQKTISELEQQIAELQSEKDQLSGIYEAKNYETLSSFYDAFIKDSEEQGKAASTSQQLYNLMVQGIDGISESLSVMIEKESAANADEKTKAIAKAKAAWETLQGSNPGTTQYNTNLEAYHSAAAAAKAAGAEESDFASFAGITKTADTEKGASGQNAWKVSEGDLDAQKYAASLKFAIQHGDEYWEGTSNMETQYDPTILRYIFDDIKKEKGSIILPTGEIISPWKDERYAVKKDDDSLLTYANRISNLSSGAISEAIFVGWDGDDEAVWYKNGVMYKITSKGNSNGFQTVKGKTSTIWGQEITKSALGSLDLRGGGSLINELGTEAIITPSGTITALPSHTGIVPADITKNLWALGEVAPSIMRTMEAHLIPDTIGKSAISNNTDESFNIDSLTMNVNADDSFDADAFVESIKQRVSLTRNTRR